MIYGSKKLLKDLQWCASERYGEYTLMSRDCKIILKLLEHNHAPPKKRNTRKRNRASFR